MTTGWSDQNWVSFFQRMSDYWPGSLITKAGDGLMKVWKDELSSLPPAACLGALRKLKTEEEFSRAPSISKVKKLAVGMSGGEFRATSHHGRLRERLQEIAENSDTYWTSPKGIRCRITKDGLWRRDNDQVIPWGNLKPEDLQRVLDGPLTTSLPPSPEQLKVFRARVEAGLARWRSKSGEFFKGRREVPGGFVESIEMPEVPKDEPIEYYDPDEPPF